MRISDWSSDVCSSDLDWGIRAVDREWAVRPVSYGFDFENGINEFEGVYINADGAPASGSRPASEFPPLMMSDLSSFIPGGVFSGGSSRRDRFYRDGQLVTLGPDVQTGQPINIGTTDRSEEHTSELQSLMRISYA